jgi:hypothetical protein
VTEICGESAISEMKEDTLKHSLQERRNGGTPVEYSGRIDLKREQCGMYTSC